VAAELRPPELARLVDFAERARDGDWSLRSALVRYAQSQPVRVSQVLEQVRRIEAALHLHAKVLAADGPEVWAALDGGPPPSDELGEIVGVLGAAARLDDLADLLTAWAIDRTGPQPHDEVDAALAEVTVRLDDLGVAREEPGPRSRRR
jgi:hypothetical protein